MTESAQTQTVAMQEDSVAMSPLAWKGSLHTLSTSGGTRQGSEHLQAWYLGSRGKEPKFQNSLVFKTLVLKKIWIYFIVVKCVGLPAYMSVHSLHARCLWRSKEAVRST